MKLTYLFTTIVVASQATVHQPKSVAATVLLGSTSANYQKALGRFTDRLINCQFHKKFMPRGLGKMCKDVISDYRVIFNKDVETLQNSCKHTHRGLVPCFPTYTSRDYVTRSVARGKSSHSPPLYYFYATSEE